MRIVPFLLGFGFLSLASTPLAVLPYSIAEADAVSTAETGEVHAISTAAMRLREGTQSRLQLRLARRSTATLAYLTPQQFLPQLAQRRTWRGPSTTESRNTVAAQQTPQVAQVSQAPTIHTSAAIDAVFAQTEIRRKHQEIARKAHYALPARCHGTLKNFYVRYDNPKNRGLAGASVMILSGNVPDKEFRALYVHEYGHITDIGCMNGTEASGESPFRDGSKPVYYDDPSLDFYRISWVADHTKREGVRAEDFVSGYASYDAFEDFAESYAYFVLQREAFAARAVENPSLAAKYRWLEQNIFGQQFRIASSATPWRGKVPWDVTKLAYVWLPL